MKRVGGRLVTIACVAALAFVVLAILLPSLLGLQRYVITGGSMTGTIPKGAVIYSRITPVGQLRVGDIITFHPPGYPTAVTHRITAIEAGPDGWPAFRTKGDFNQTADPWGPVTLNEPQQARYVFQIPLLGLRAGCAHYPHGAHRLDRRPGGAHRPVAALVAVAPGRRGGRSAARRRRRPPRREEPGVSLRRILLLVVLGVVAVAGASVAASRASYTTSSQSDITASADSATGWLHLFSQATDPDGLTAYATQRVQTGVGPVCATGADCSLSLVMGGVRTNGTSYTLNRAFTIKTVTAFPVTSIAQVTVTAAYIADPATGLQPIRDCRFSTTTVTGGSASVSIGVNTKRQANIRMRMNGKGWVVGRTYYPTLRLTVSYTGGPAGYYVYDIPLSVTATSW